MNRQDFLAGETDATGIQLDGLVSKAVSATTLHRHASSGLWITMPTPSNGWTIVNPCEYMIDTFGFVRLRGAINGFASTSSVIWSDFPDGDLKLAPLGFAWWMVAVARPGFVVGALDVTTTIIEYKKSLASDAEPFRIDIDPVMYFPQQLS